MDKRELLSGYHPRLQPLPSKDELAKLGLEHRREEATASRSVKTTANIIGLVEMLISTKMSGYKTFSQFAEAALLEHIRFIAEKLQNKEVLADVARYQRVRQEFAMVLAQKELPEAVQKYRSLIYQMLQADDLPRARDAAVSLLRVIGQAPKHMKAELQRIAVAGWYVEKQIENDESEDVKTEPMLEFDEEDRTTTFILNIQNAPQPDTDPDVDFAAWRVRGGNE